MNVSINWLSAMLGRSIDPRDAANRLAMLCVPVDSVEPLFEELNDVVVATVESVKRHPDADRLTVCQVNDGSTTIEVVCGAPNVTAGKKYPYAAVGSVLPGGLTLTARKIRGIVSNGMLLSEREMQLGTDHTGIMELATDAAPGTKLVDALRLADTRLELDVTANRPDLLGHKGVARELGASLGVPAKLEPIPDAPPEGPPPVTSNGPAKVGGIEVAIEDVEGCPRYMAAVIRGVKVAPSPTWLQARLRSVGARPINNVVDATNYILFELNQPLHAFDLAKIRDARIVVRAARAGEHMTTLDGEKREFQAGMTLICDGKGATAIGGVMGGGESEVSDETTDILLECAYFDPKRIRATRKALKLTTDASYRFERGTDFMAMPDVMRRAVALIRAVAGGDEPEPAVDVYPKPAKSRTVFLRPDRVAHVLGISVASDVAQQLLTSVGFVVAPKQNRLAVQVPGWRPDVTREVDLIEEVARLHGYDQFPTELRPYRPSSVPDDPVEPLKARARRVLTGLGLHEARSVSLVGAGEAQAQGIVNPMSLEEAYLRESLLPGLVRSAQRNWSVRERDIRLFEIGVVFHESGAGRQPDETLRLAGVLSGAGTPPHWSAAGKSQDYDEWDLKYIFGEAVRVCGAEGEIVEDDAGWLLRDAAGNTRGWARELRADQPAWAAPLYGFELDIVVGRQRGMRYEPVPSTPPVERDLALVLPPGVEAGDVESVIVSAASELLETATVFDEYRTSDLLGRSVAWRLVFRARDRTLKDREVDKIVSRVLKLLKDKLGVERRQA
ncbi:MAG: phenylalanine--tRNA ligase subunit beta [Gemmatimonadota bacterium]|nr:MAG: phenylalanine--tRNA ligase subunit beta [Gemmatimonadota bacterium]